MSSWNKPEASYKNDKGELDHVVHSSLEFKDLQVWDSLLLLQEDNEWILN
jgi:hypothetical protein